MVYASSRSRAVEEALNRIEELQLYLPQESSESFEAWFRDEYGFDPDRRSKVVWEQLF